MRKKALAVICIGAMILSTMTGCTTNDSSKAENNQTQASNKESVTETGSSEENNGQEKPI